MRMDPRRFKENVLLYGADLSQWPGEIREAGGEAFENSPELQAFLAEHERFERILRTRKYEEPRGNLSERIVSLSLRQEKRLPFSLGSFLRRLFSDEFYLPKPALIVVSVLMITALLIGFVIGFSDSTGSVSADQRQASLQEFLHYEGDTL